MNSTEQVDLGHGDRRNHRVVAIKCWGSFDKEMFVLNVPGP